MKILKLVLVIIISITPFSGGFGQSTYEPDEFYSSQGDSNLRSGSDSLSDLISNLDRFSRIEDNETKKILRGSIAQASWAKMNNVRRNVDQANLKLHYALNEEKNELRYIYKKKALTRVNELAVAKAWWDSPTCKRQIPRRDWFNLSAEERAMYSHRYMQYHNPELFESINEMTLDIPESEYAMAWNIRHLSNPGVPSWKEVKNFKSKNNFRKSYYSHKLAKVNPKIFISEEEASLIPKENLVIICTGSQGEKRSALYRIAYNSHRHIHLEKDDVVIFSSRDIPGNEKSINGLKNLLIRQRVEIITADDDLVHVSGHGHAEEIKQMYNWTKPYISIPVHGEPMHLASHKKISEASQVPVTKILQNGKCLKIAPGDCSIVDNIDTGKLIVEGKFLYDSESDFIKDRRRYSYEGIAMISVLLNNDYSIDKNIQLSLIGLPVDELHFIKEEFKDEFVKNFTKLNDDQKSSDQNVIDIIRKSLKFVLKNILQKKPEIQIHLIRK